MHVQSGGYNIQKHVDFDRNNSFVLNHIDWFIKNKDVISKNNKI